MPQLELLGERLGLPGRITTKAGDNVTRLESLSIICRRLSESSKLLTIAKEFGRSPAAISRIVKHVARLLYGMHKSKLYFNRRLITSRIAAYCSAINENGAPLTNVWAFIDGTKRILHAQLQGLNTVIATKNLQCSVYNGHPRRHCLNWQALTTPDGRYVYGDPAYGCNRFMICPFASPAADSNERRFNARMSKVREAVEWSFGRLKILWPFVFDDKKMQSTDE
ncbi:hypothetical protein H257_02517 [Aphanomyces astaci]|uniref:DDE Tnp4 domain-containing protein n=1 Tax=Aphanomyces astaci TaxID=112090 RepID=W4H441_APHAT|nr:hypothetical protein H257_02517 [Aphanomyces astaci]ETV86029.1 hypothetical protein H257_02517 [Aphanomyces astaci]|eukprot:XP_009824501.1 hypothetical protein H257_02517 [Aphanomyces astaci]